MIGKEPKYIAPEKESQSEETAKLQAGYLDSVEKWVKERRNADYTYDRKLSDEERKLEPIFNDPKKAPAYIDRTREFKDHSIEEQRASEKVWVIIDFDDVISKTTTYYNTIKDRFHEVINLDKNEFTRLYEESKIINNEGKKVLRFNILIDKIKALNPGREELIDKLLAEDIKPNDFIDQGVKRALLVLENASFDKKDIRISVLTFGDINYQKNRIDKTDISDAVDDLIYTEGSKREVLEALLEKDYKSKGIIPPLMITLDDSKEQIKDYSDVNLPSNFINLHYQNAQGKKSLEESAVKEVIALKEKEKNEAALNFYRICKICLNPEMHLSRKELHESFNDKNIDDIYKNQEIKRDPENKTASRIDSTGRLHYIKFGEADYTEEELKKRIIDNDGFTAWDYYLSLKNPIHRSFETNITYYKDANGDVIRRSDRHRYKKNNEGVLEEDNIYHYEENIATMGALTPLIDAEEFIKNAK